MKIIGIAGGTGSGKSTLALNLCKLLGENRTQIIAHDSYYRDQSHMSREERLVVNYDHPDSLETELLVKHLQQLKMGKSIQVPLYDFAHNTRDTTQAQKVDPSDYLIIEGILLFSSPELVQELDLAVFIDVPADIRLIRRVHRDIATRGRTWEFTFESWENFAHPMHEQFVEPSKQGVDLIIPGGGKNKKGLAQILQTLDKI